MTIQCTVVVDVNNILRKKLLGAIAVKCKRHTERHQHEEQEKPAPTQQSKWTECEGVQGSSLSTR